MWKYKIKEMEGNSNNDENLIQLGKTEQICMCWLTLQTFGRLLNGAAI